MTAKPKYAEDVEVDILFEGAEIAKAFNASDIVQDLIDKFGASAPDHAAEMAELAQAMDEKDIAEDFKLVQRMIIERLQEKRRGLIGNHTVSL